MRCRTCLGGTRSPPRRDRSALAKLTRSCPTVATPAGRIRRRVDTPHRGARGRASRGFADAGADPSQPAPTRTAGCRPTNAWSCSATPCSPGDRRGALPPGTRTTRGRSGQAAHSIVNSQALAGVAENSPRRASVSTCLLAAARSTPADTASPASRRTPRVADRRSVPAARSGGRARSHPAAVRELLDTAPTLGAALEGSRACRN